MSDKQKYFEQSSSWAADSQASAAKSTRVAWIVVGVALGVAAFEAVALAMLAPLKTVQPITLLVDRQTGFVQTVDPTSPRRITADDALTQAFLAQYVSAREGFDRATIPADYRKVALWSGGPARSSYLAEIPPANPASPFNRFAPGTVVSVKVKSVSRLGDNLALVRFDTLIQDLNGRFNVAQPWIATVRYRYVSAPMSLDDRLVNPLGFQVMSYRRDLESPSEISGPPNAGETGAPSRASPSQTNTSGQPSATNASAGLVKGRAVPLNHFPMGSPVSAVEGSGQ